MNPFSKAFFKAILKFCITKHLFKDFKCGLTFSGHVLTILLFPILIVFTESILNKDGQLVYLAKYIQSTDISNLRKNVDK